MILSLHPKHDKPGDVSPWPHQQQALAAILDAHSRHQAAGLVVMPTGTGKTILFCMAARSLGHPTLVLTHRDELIRQTANSFAAAWPDAILGVVQADRDEWHHGQTVVIASVQSLHQQRLSRMPRDRFGVLVIDEAHHAIAPTYSRVLEHFLPRFVLGVTATPDRLDGRGLAEHFGPKPIYTYSLRQAVDESRLARPCQYAIETGISLDAVKTRMGDFAEQELALAVGTAARNRVVVEAFQRYAEGRRAIAFAVDLAHVRSLSGAFQDAGIATAIVTGKDDREVRRQTLEDFAAGQYQVLVNCEICTEGFDDRAVSCIIMARPTQSRALYTQCVGRGLRLCPEMGKKDCLILDITDNSTRHKLITVLDLFASPKRRDAKGRDVIEVLEDEQCEIRDQIETLNHEPAYPLKWRLKEVSPWPELPSLETYQPTRFWHRDPATPKQVECLRRFGLDLKRDSTKGEAAHLLDQAFQYDSVYPAPATTKQQWFLRYAGQWREGMSKREASQLIVALKQEPEGNR